MNVFKVSKELIVFHVMSSYTPKYASGEKEMLGASTFLPASELQKIWAAAYFWQLNLCFFKKIKPSFI